MRVRSQSPAPSCGADPLAPQGAALPFLPTLVTALALGGLGLLCRGPATPESAPPAPTALATRMIETPSTSTASVAPLPGVKAFGRQYPLSTLDAALLATPRASRMATVVKHRCASGRCEAARPAAASPPADPVASTGSTAPTPFAPQRRPDESEDWLPFQALPFAPTASALLDGARGLSSRAVTLGGSVVSMIASE